MKKCLCILLLLTLLYSVCGCAITGSQPSTTAPTEPDYSSIMKEAEALYHANNLEAALAKFAEAGEMGQERIAELREELYYEIKMTNMAGGRADALAMLEDAPEGLVDAETRKLWICEIYQEPVDKYSKTINGEYAYSNFSYSVVEELRALSEEIAASPIGGSPEAQAMIDTNTMNQAIAVWQYAYDNYDLEDPGLEEAYQLFASCSENSPGWEIAKAIDMIRAGEYEDSIPILQAHIVSEDRHAYFLSRYTKPTQERTVADLLQFNVAYNLAKGETRYTGGLEDLIPSTVRCKYGILDGSGITDEQRKELKDLCGDAPEGRILFLHRWSEYQTGKKMLKLDFEMMDRLPAEYYPETPEQAEYIILLDTTYYSNGVFYNGTVRILETTTLTLYKNNGSVLYSKTVSGETSDTMYYQGKAPEYYSAGSPDMTDAIKEALAIIAGE